MNKADNVDVIVGNPNIREIRLRPNALLSTALLEIEVLPVVSSLVNLTKVHISERFILGWFSSFGQPYKFEKLQPAIQVPSVRHLEFVGKAKCPNYDRHASILRMFPNLDTRVPDRSNDSRRQKCLVTFTKADPFTR